MLKKILAIVSNPFFRSPFTLYPPCRLCGLLLFMAIVMGSPQPLWGRLHFSRPSYFVCSDKNRLSAENHLKMGLNAFHQHHWHVAARHLRILTRDFHPSFYPTEVHYFLGLSFYHLKEFDLANDAWNMYLQKDAETPHADEVMQKKLEIAERCRAGATARLFGIRAFPKWSSGDSLALTVYDEIIATVPTSDLAAISLIGRGRLFCKQSAFSEAIDSLYLMVRRFPQHELTPEADLAMQEVYLAQAKADGQNPDTLSLAELALNRFASSFPKEDRLEQARQLFAQMRDVQANSLYQTARFYCRLQQPRAAALYCKATLRQFPDTPTAERCRRTLACLEPEPEPEPCSPSYEAGAAQAVEVDSSIRMPEDLSTFQESSEEELSLL